MARKNKIEISKFRVNIEEMIVSGKSPRQISLWLKENGENISYKAIERFREKNIPEAKILHPSILQKRLEGVERKLGELDVMLDIILVQIMRIDKGLDSEDEGGKLLPEVSKEMDRAWGYIQDRIKMLQDLGMLPSRDITVPSTEVKIFNANSANASVNQPQTLKELLQNVEPERRRDFISNIGNAIRQIGGGAQGC